MYYFFIMKFEDCRDWYIGIAIYERQGFVARIFDS